MVNGRGAWPVSGLGGTKKYKDSTRPGPYYYLGTGENADLSDPNTYAVVGAVKAYQRALNRRLGLNLADDGVFGTVTSQAVTTFQQQNVEQTGTPWGGIGPDSSKALFLPDVEKVWRNRAASGLPLSVITGTINHESQWDAGAVGYIDPRDVGLAQINAAAHPDLTVDDRLEPIPCFRFVVDYYNNALATFKGNVRDAVASYNLGAGGTSRWISQGRPEWYTPQGSTSSRNVWDYIDSILAG